MGRSIDRQRPYPRLFEPGELDLRPTEGARLRQLARLPLRPATVREERRKESRQVMKKLRAWGTELAARFELEFLSIDPERASVIEHYGVCYEDGAIRIRLRHARTGRLLKESSLVDTLCHELAHLKYMDHGLRFRCGAHWRVWTTPTPATPSGSCSIGSGG